MYIHNHKNTTAITGTGNYLVDFRLYARYLCHAQPMESFSEQGKVLSEKFRQYGRRVRVGVSVKIRVRFRFICVGDLKCSHSLAV